MRRFVAISVAALLVACGGGGDDETTDTVALENIEPIVDIAPCDLIDDQTASELSGAEVEAAEDSTEDDGTTRCDFAFADEAVADETGSAIAASLSIGPGSEDDVPGGSLATSLSMGDRAAVETVEDESKVRVVYIVREVVVRVEVVSGDGEVDQELIDEVVEFTETTEGPVTEAVTGEPFEGPTTTAGEAPTTTFVDEDIPEGPPIEVDGDAETLTVERAGGNANAVFEAEEGDAIFVEVTATSRTPADSTECLVVRIIHAQDFSINSVCAQPDGSAFIDRTELDVTGAYQILFDPDGPITGSVEVQITSATDEEGTIEVDGATETATVTDKGGVSVLEFEATEGDAIFVSVVGATRIPADSTECMVVRIIHPDEFSINSVCAQPDGSAFIDRTELDITGTYQILFDPDARVTGSVQVQVTAAD